MKVLTIFFSFTVLSTCFFQQGLLAQERIPFVNLPHTDEQGRPLEGIDMAWSGLEGLKEGILRVVQSVTREKLSRGMSDRLGELTLSQGQRELIGAYVSSLNECQYCSLSHGKFAAGLLKIEGLEGNKILDMAALREYLQSNGPSPKMKALFKIASAVASSASGLKRELVESDKNTEVGEGEEKITEADIYVTICLSSAFSMFNRLVDGLNTTLPPKEAYNKMAEHINKNGYIKVKSNR